MIRRAIVCLSWMLLWVAAMTVSTPILVSAIGLFAAVHLGLWWKCLRGR